MIFKVGALTDLSQTTFGRDVRTLQLSCGCSICVRAKAFNALGTCIVVTYTWMIFQRGVERYFQTSISSSLRKTWFHDFPQKIDEMVFWFTPNYNFKDCSQNGCVIKQPGRSCQVSMHPVSNRTKLANKLAHLWPASKTKNFERCCNKCP